MEEEARGRCVMPRLVQCIQIWRNRVPSGQWAADSMGEQVGDSQKQNYKKIYFKIIICIIVLLKNSGLIEFRSYLRYLLTKYFTK